MWKPSWDICRWSRLQTLQSVTLAQILRADKEVWLHMSQHVENIRATLVETSPWTQPSWLRSKIIVLPFISYHWWKNSPGRWWKRKERCAIQPKRSKRKRQRQERQIIWFQFGTTWLCWMHWEGPKGRPICFDYNISGCQHAADGAACRKDDMFASKQIVTNPINIVWLMLMSQTCIMTASFKRVSQSGQRHHDHLRVVLWHGRAYCEFQTTWFCKRHCSWQSQKQVPHASVIQLDFTDPSNQLLISDWIRNRNVVAIFMAPPCGTCSLARNIPIPDDPFPPQPLRSMTEPDGLRSLRGRDRLRVSQANILYAFCQEVMDLACSLSIACMIENPKNSLFWFTTAWRDVAHHHMLTYAYHQACAYGGCRPKWTCLCANFPEAALISGVCDNSHQHKPWGVVKEKGKKTFATALEVHYPAALCDAIVNAFTVHFHSRYDIRDSDSVSNAVFQASSGVQPAGNKLPPLFSPFSDVFVAFEWWHW